MRVTRRTGQVHICLHTLMGSLWQPESLVLDSIWPDLLCLCHCEAHPLQPKAFPKGDVLRLLNAVQVGVGFFD